MLTYSGFVKLARLFKIMVLGRLCYFSNVLSYLSVEMFENVP